MVTRASWWVSRLLPLTLCPFRTEADQVPPLPISLQGFPITQSRIKILPPGLSTSLTSSSSPSLPQTSLRASAVTSPVAGNAVPLRIHVAHPGLCSGIPFSKRIPVYQIHSSCALLFFFLMLLTTWHSLIHCMCSSTGEKLPQEAACCWCLEHSRCSIKNFGMNGWIHARCWARGWGS